MLPTHFQISPIGLEAMSPANAFGQNSIYLGDVVGEILPSSAGSRYKIATEYDVSVQVQKDSEISSRTVRCFVPDQFGGIADTSSHSFRVATFGRRSKQVQVGAKVLVAFINGDSNLGIILGGFRERGAKSSLTGRFLKWVFNGISVNINDDGELRIRANGATKNDGTPDANRDDTNQGPYVQFTKDGNLYLTDNNGQSITVNSREKAIRILATEQSQLNAKRVILGSQTATENLVLGQSMVKALNELIDLFIKNPQVGTNGAGPVTLNPAILAGLLKWKAAWVTNAPGPAKILSAKSYTER